jgi:DnaA family protein
MGKSNAAQLALGVHLRDDATLENYLFLPALEALRPLLENQLTAAGEPAIYLHGPPGSGRSHLLQAACHRLPAGQALYLPLEQLVDIPADQVLAEVEQLALVCLDNLDAVIGNDDWERALFNLCNRARESGARLLFAAAVAPRQLGVQLPDLQSRLSWGVVVQLPEPADEDKLGILRFRAERRGLQLSREVATYILSRAPRSLTALMETLERLDRESLVHKRQLSIPFVKQSMGW